MCNWIFFRSVLKLFGYAESLEILIEILKQYKSVDIVSWRSLFNMYIYTVVSWSAHAGQLPCLQEMFPYTLQESKKRSGKSLIWVRILGTCVISDPFLKFVSTIFSHWWHKFNLLQYNYGQTMYIYIPVHSLPLIFFFLRARYIYLSKCHSQ